MISRCAIGQSADGPDERCTEYMRLRPRLLTHAQSASSLRISICQERSNEAYTGLNQRQNTKSAFNSTNTSEFFALGIVGYILLSILFLTMVRD
jgi:hypothetical protein